MSQRLYTFLLFLPNSPLPRSFSLGSRYPARFVPARLRSIFSVRAGQLPVVSLYRRRNEAIRRNENGARQRPARLRGTGNPRPPTLPPPLVLCSREAPCECAPRCIQTMFVPFASRALPLSWAPFVYSRPLFRHPSRRSNNTLDSSFTRSLSLSLSFALSLSLWFCHRSASRSLARAFLRTLPMRDNVPAFSFLSLLIHGDTSACSFPARSYARVTEALARRSQDTAVEAGNVEYSAGISRSPVLVPLFSRSRLWLSSTRASGALGRNAVMPATDVTRLLRVANWMRMSTR